MLGNGFDVQKENEKMHKRQQENTMLRERGQASPHACDAMRENWWAQETENARKQMHEGQQEILRESKRAIHREEAGQDQDSRMCKEQRLKEGVDTKVQFSNTAILSDLSAEETSVSAVEGLSEADSEADKWQNDHGLTRMEEKEVERKERERWQLNKAAAHTAKMQRTTLEDVSLVVGEDNELRHTHTSAIYAHLAHWEEVKQQYTQTVGTHTVVRKGREDSSVGEAEEPQGRKKSLREEMAGRRGEENERFIAKEEERRAEEGRAIEQLEYFVHLQQKTQVLNQQSPSIAAIGKDAGDEGGGGGGKGEGGDFAVSQGPPCALWTPRIPIVKIEVTL